MAKEKKIFECQACGFQSPKWLGKCTNCGTWDSMLELTKEQIKFIKETSSNQNRIKATPITKIAKEDINRFSSKSRELDLVLGGGVVEGSLILIGGSLELENLLYS